MSNQILSSTRDENFGYVYISDPDNPSKTEKILLNYAPASMSAEIKFSDGRISLAYRTKYLNRFLATFPLDQFDSDGVSNKSISLKNALLSSDIELEDAAIKAERAAK